VIAAGVRCEEVAPSKMDRPLGDRIKTDRRDAERLARLLRIDELPGVRVPSEAEEAARDLLRAREDARGDLIRVRRRLSQGFDVGQSGVVVDGDVEVVVAGRGAVDLAAAGVFPAAVQPPAPAVRNRPSFFTSTWSRSPVGAFVADAGVSR
jgi:hypothetical protein